MKIGEYIELVKQAKGPDVSPVPTPPPFNGVTEPILNGPPPVILNNGTEVVSTNSEAPQFLPLDEIKKRNANTNHGVSRPGTPLQLDPAQTGAKPKTTPSEAQIYYEPSNLQSKPVDYRFSPRIDPKTGLLPRSTPSVFGDPLAIPEPFKLEHPDLYPDKSFLQRLKGMVTPKDIKKWVTSFGDPNAWKAYANKKVNNLNSALNSPVKPHLPGFNLPGLMDSAFIVGVPMTADSTQDRIQTKAMTDANRANMSPYTAWIPGITRQLEEGAYQTPSMVGEGLNFLVNPVSSVSMLNMLGNVALGAPEWINQKLHDIGAPQNVGLPETKFRLPAFYHMDPDNLRFRPDYEYKALENDSYWEPDLIRQQDNRYRWNNRIADYVGAVVDPMLQIMPGFYWGPGGGGVHQIGEFIHGKGKDFKYNIDPTTGREVLDYQDLLKYILGSKSNEELKGIKKLVDSDIQPLIRAAYENGFTDEDIARAMVPYKAERDERGKKNGIYDLDTRRKDVNMLKMMAIPPHQLWNTEWVRTSKDTLVNNYKKIPQYIPGFVRWNGLYFEPRMIENPAWREAYDKAERFEKEREVFLSLYPQFRDLNGANNNEYFTVEEKKLLEGDIKDLDLDNIANWDLDKDIISSGEGYTKYRRIAALPPNERLLVLLKHPEYWDPLQVPDGALSFIDWYYPYENGEQLYLQQQVLDYLQRLKPQFDKYNQRRSERLKHYLRSIDPSIERYVY